MTSTHKTSQAAQSSNASDDYKPGSLAIFEFTPEDLRANQRGRLTDAQRGWPHSTARGIVSCSLSSTVVALIFVFIGLSLTLGLYLSNDDSRRALFSSPMNLIGLAAGGAIGVAAIGGSVLLSRRQADSVARAPLKVVHGTVRFDEDYSSRSGMTSYDVIVGREKFSYTDDMSAVFHEGRPYTIYFCQSGPYKLIMSFEETDG